jgi:hypothetical protein
MHKIPQNISLVLKHVDEDRILNETFIQRNKKLIQKNFDIEAAWTEIIE